MEASGDTSIGCHCCCHYMEVNFRIKKDLELVGLKNIYGMKS